MTPELKEAITKIEEEEYYIKEFFDELDFDSDLFDEDLDVWLVDEECFDE